VLLRFFAAILSHSQHSMTSQATLPMTERPTENALAHSNFIRTLFASSGKVSLYQCCGVLLSFGFQAFVSRTCGADALGAVTIFLAWLGILSVLTVPGLEGALVYLLPRLEGQHSSTRRLVRQSLLIACAASLVVTAGTGLAGPRLFARAGLPDQARAAFCIALIAFSVGKVFDAVFLSFKDAPALSYFNNIRTVARFVFSLPVLFFPAARWTILFWAVTLECLLAVVLRILRLRQMNPDLASVRQVFGAQKPGEDNPPEQRHTLGSIMMPMLGISVIDTVYPLLDKAVLGVMVPLALVGIYRISDAVSTVNAMFVLPFIAFYPYISQLHEQNRLHDLRESYRAITLSIIALMLPFTLILIELSPTILSYFGPTFVAQGKNIFLILAFGTAIDAIAGPAGAVLKLTGHPRLSFGINTVWLVVYLGLAIVLTKRYGIVGAAIAKATSTVVGNLANVVANGLVLKVFPYTWKHAWLLIAGAAILATRRLMFPGVSTMVGQALVGMVQAAAFSAIAFFLLRRQINRILQSNLFRGMRNRSPLSCN
jgi:O-antigen/teichoic acid export membrane protein